VNLPAGEADRQRIAESVNDRVDFGREPAARPSALGMRADGLAEAAFLRAPALCQWALTMVASIIAYSLPGSSARALKRLFPNAAFGPPRKALVRVVQPPKRSGKSRHGAPARSFQITASTNSRLPAIAVTPGGARTARQQIFNPRELAVPQSMAFHRKAS
jgi:hypothetical protein